MIERTVREAWVAIPTEAEVLAQRPEAARGGGYAFGFVAAMGRLISTHPRIGRAFSSLFREIMFEPGFLSRREKEMVAAVAAAAQDCQY